MLNNETRQQIAQEIYDCYKNTKQISLLTKTYPEIEQEDSYRIQEQVIARFIEDGRKVKGYKIGLTSKAMQDMAGTTEPDYSVLTDDMFVEMRKYWSDDQIVEIVGSISLFGFLNSRNDTLATPLEHEPIEVGERFLAPRGWSVGKHA